MFKLKGPTTRRRKVRVIAGGAVVVWQNKRVAKQIAFPLTLFPKDEEEWTEL